MKATEAQIDAAIASLGITGVHAALRDVIYHLYGSAKQKRGSKTAPKFEYTYDDAKEWDQSTIEMISDVIGENGLSPAMVCERFTKDGRAKE